MYTLDYFKQDGISRGRLAFSYGNGNLFQTENASESVIYHCWMEKLF